MDVHFSSKTDMWATPQDTFDALAAEFGPFDIDVCATPENAKCPRYYTPEDDGLAQPLEGSCWMNPQYGREIKTWMRKSCASKPQSTRCGGRRMLEVTDHDTNHRHRRPLRPLRKRGL